jgi:hypothetical protein
MGHDSMHADLIYQHATRDADRAIADALDRLGRGVWRGEWHGDETTLVADPPGDKAD